MKKVKRGSAVIRAWTEEGKKKVTIQIEDRSGSPLAFIQLTPDKASDLADTLAIYAAKLKMASRDKTIYRSNATGRSALLC